MSSEGSRKYEKSTTVNVTVGNPDEESDDDQNLQEHIRSISLDREPLENTNYVDDRDVLPSSSQGCERPSTSRMTREPTEEQRRLELGVAPDEFVEEYYVEKPVKIINGYIFGEVLGDGAYSKVKECTNSQTLELCSIKISKDRKLQKIPGGTRNAETEVRILRLLNHANVVRFIDHFYVPEKAKQYLVLERCVCSLQQMLDQQPNKRLPEFQCRGYFRQLMTGLDYLHSAGIVHKDIKPGNLLISAYQIIKICDMGVSEEFLNAMEDDWCTVAPGTAKFQPPEAVSSSVESFRGRPIDIWSSGVTLYNMFSGDYPYEGDTVLLLYENIQYRAVTWPNIELGEDLHTLLSHMLEKDPDRRWDSVAIKNSAWYRSDNQVQSAQFVLPVCQYNMAKSQSRDVVGKTVQWNLDEAAETVGQLREERAAQRQQAAQNRVSRFGRLRRLICPWGSQVHE